MEIIQNRYGEDRVIEKIAPDKLRVMGESNFSRTSVDDDGKIIMFDFEGGPFLMVGSSIKYLKSDWLVKEITIENSIGNNLESVILKVELDGRT